MPSLLRAALASLLVCAPVAVAHAEEPLPPLPGAWSVAAQLRLRASLDDGVGILLPPRPLLATVLLDAESRRFGVSLLRPDELWLLQTGKLASDSNGQPRLAPDDLVEQGVVEAVCAELRNPPPCDAPLDSLALEVAESVARARIRGNVLLLAGRLRLVIVDPERPSLRIRVGVAYAGRGTQPAPDSAAALVAAR